MVSAGLPDGKPKVKAGAAAATGALVAGASVFGAPKEAPKTGAAGVGVDACAGSEGFGADGAPKLKSGFSATFGASDGGAGAAAEEAPKAKTGFSAGFGASAAGEEPPKENAGGLLAGAARPPKSGGGAGASSVVFCGLSGVDVTSTGVAKGRLGIVGFSVSGAAEDAFRPPKRGAAGSDAAVVAEADEVAADAAANSDGLGTLAPKAKAGAAGLLAAAAEAA